MNETIKATLTADGTQFNREFQRTEQTVTGFQGKMMVAAKAIAGFFAARALLRGVNTLRQEIDDLGKTATRLRLPTAQVQVLEIAAKRGGTNIDNLVRSLNRAQVAATDAGRGTLEYTREFAALNINVAEFQRLDPQERLRVLADAYKNATDQGEAFTALTRIMGRGVSQLIPLLQGGSEALDDLASKVNIIDETQIRRIEEFNDRITLLSGNLKSQLMEAFISLEPQLTWFSERMAKALENTSAFLDVAKGTGTRGDLADALEAYSELYRLGGPDADLTAMPKRFQEIQKRFNAMAEDIKIEAKELGDLNFARELFRTGGADRDTFEHMAQQIRETADLARAILAEDNARATVNDDIADAIESQVRAMEQLATAEARARVDLEKRLFALQSEEEQLAAIRKEAEEIRKANGNAQSLEFLRNRIDQIDDPEERLKAIQDLNRLLELRDQALDIQQKIQRTAQDTADAEAAAAADALRAKERELAAAQELARIQASQDRAKENFAAETEALKLELAGRKDLADALREEVRMRADAVSLAERMGSTEEEALALLRQQAQLRRQLEGRETDRRPSSRDTRPRFGSDAIRGARGLGRGPTLREASLDRLAANRTANTPPTDAARQEAAKYWEQQLDLQAQLLKKFTQLTTV